MNEESIIQELKKNNIWCSEKGKKWTGNDQYHNFYTIGFNEHYIFGELDFGTYPIWRVLWYKEGKTYHNTGFLENSFDKLLNIVLTLSIPGVRQQMIDIKKSEIEKDFK